MIPLTTSEANCLADINNPGFGGPLYEGDLQATIVFSMCTNIEDTFLNLYPGSFGKKWDIDEKVLLDKLRTAKHVDLRILADAITRFWDECIQGKGMEDYYATS